MGVPAGAGPGVLPRAGKGRADFWALAGTARGESGVATPGRVTGVGAPGARGEATGTPAGRGVGRGIAPGVAAGAVEVGLNAAIPGFGIGLRLIFSA